MTDRRSFIAALAGLASAPRAALAQQRTQTPRLGILRLSPPRASYEDVFIQTLRDEGFVEGKTLAIDDRHAGGDPARLPALAAELVQVPVNVIFARGAQALAAAKQATHSMPIVAFDDVTDPVRSGFVTSLARPGGNVTGVFLNMPELMGKWLGFLVDVAPRLDRVALVWDPSAGVAQRDAAQSAARALHKELQVLDVPDVAAFASAFEAAVRGKAGGMLVLSSPFMRINSKTIADLALRARLAAMAPYRDFPETGGLMSYGPYLPSWYQRCGVQLAKILRGAKAGELPVERPDRFELIVNASTAKALRLPIPPSLLARADEVIR